MSDSQALVSPYYVQLNSVAKDGKTNKAFPFLVVHEGPSDSGSDQKWGWVYVGDEDNTIGGPGGGQIGVGWLSDIGRGKPGDNVSWSPISLG